MRIGVVLLPELPWSQDRFRWQRAESLGFAHAWTYDHLAWRTLADGPWHATIPTLTAAALATTRIQLGTLVTTPNFRHPVPLAKDVMTLDVMSEGRIAMAIGAGALGYDASVLGGATLEAASRHERFVEFVEVLDTALRQRVTDFHGAWYEAVGARMIPGPIQQPRPPLLIAANGPKGIRLAVSAARRAGDGWVTLGPQDPAVSDTAYWRAVGDAAGTMDDVLQERQPQGFRRLIYLGSRASTTSSIEHLRDHIGRAAELDFTDFVVAWPRPTDPFKGSEGLMDQLACDLSKIQGPPN